MKNVEDVLPLTPMQELMLLHLASARGSDALIEQMVLRLEGPVDPDRMQLAWQTVIDRHSILRASFAWEGLSKPVQVIRRDVKVPWQLLDWRGESGAAQRGLLETMTRGDRQNGFDARKAPLLRIALIHVGQDAWWMLFSAHHILLDRWSVGIVLKEVFATHAALQRGRQPDLPPAVSYRQYIEYIQKLTPETAEKYWRELLADIPPATTRIPAAPDAVNMNDESFATEEFTFDSGFADRFREAAQSSRLSASTLVQAALAVSLGKLTGRRDVIFGVTVSARPPSLPGVEAMVGMFSNNLPVRARLSEDRTVSEWLKAVQEQQNGLRDFESTSLPLVREYCTGLQSDDPLFECLLVFQNDPAADALANASAEFGLQLQGAGGHSRTSFPITIMASQAPNLHISITVDCRRIGLAFAIELKSELVATLRQLINSPQKTLGELLRTEKVTPPAIAPVKKKLSLAETLIQSAAKVERPGAAIDPPPSLPRPMISRPSELIVPSTPVEVAIAAVWKELLRVEMISVKDNFFDIGGTSVLAVQAVKRLKDKSNLKINPMQMAIQTLGQLAAMAAGSSANVTMKSNATNAGAG